MFTCAGVSGALEALLLMAYPHRWPMRVKLATATALLLVAQTRPGGGGRKVLKRKDSGRCPCGGPASGVRAIETLGAEGDCLAVLRRRAVISQWRRRRGWRSAPVLGRSNVGT